MKMNEMIVVNELTKRYGNHTVIDHLSFSLEEGERLAFLAPSGAGKTTLLMILAGLETPDDGSFQIATNPTIVFQEPRLFPFLTVEENIFLPFKAWGRPITDSIRKTCQHWLEVCELEAYASHYPYQLSGGMKQKTALIRGLISKPRLLLLDEPFQSIDIETRRTLIATIKAAFPNLSILLVTHNLDVVAHLAQSALYFDQPCLINGMASVTDPHVDEFSSNQWPCNEQLSGLSQMNFIHNKEIL